MNAATRSTKRKRRTLTHRTLRATTGRLSVTLGAATLSARGRTVALEGAVHGTATVTGMLTTRRADSTVVNFLTKRKLLAPFAVAVWTAEGSRIALDVLAARLGALLELAGPELASVARRAQVLRAYRSAPPVEKAARRNAGAIALGITEASFVRAARRSRGGGPGKPGRPGRK